MRAYFRKLIDARDDDEFAPRHGSLEALDDRGVVVRDRGLPDTDDAQLGEPAGEVSGVGVDRVALGEL